MSGRVHSRELKLTIVRQLASGEKRPAQICREHNLASSVVSRWRNEYDQRGEEAFLPPATSAPPTAEAKIAELERFCGQLALENALLKKALGKLPQEPATCGNRAGMSGEAAHFHPSSL